MQAAQVSIVKQEGRVIIVFVSLTEECWRRRLEFALVMGWQIAQYILGRLCLLGLLVVMRRVLFGL